MRWSRTLIPTMKETPAEAEARSHVLMLRAGMIRRLGSGTYSYLPLGLRTVQKIAAIVREEMNRAGAVEVLMPLLWPLEVMTPGRQEVFGEALIRFTDRHGREGLLAPTHEEVVTGIVRDELKSYRQLPLNLYQIETKVRDEPRPRFGVIRSREFIMKDAYSFDADQAGLERSYQAMYEAYCRIFDRCGLDYVVVEADPGAMGGSRSQEFVVESSPGTAACVECTGCGYAANTEVAEVAPVPRGEPGGNPELREVATPGATTIEAVSRLLDVEPAQMIKTLIFRADGRPVAALVRGDHELNEAKLRRAFDAAAVELADAETIESVTGAPVGFAGPVGLNGVEVIADHAVMAVGDGVTGANKADAHLVGVVPGRDFRPERVGDIRTAAEGDRCARCGAALRLFEGIEIGHVFQLGTKYSEELGARFLDADGKARPYVMGCYGIGITRTAAAVIEALADEDGIVWPPSVAPYEVVVMPLDMSQPKAVAAAEEAYEALLQAGVDVILDDRAERPGVKFNDADLIGFPVRVVVGKGYLKSGALELQARWDGSREEAPPEALGERVRALLDRFEAERRAKGEARARRRDRGAQAGDAKPTGPPADW